MHTFFSDISEELSGLTERAPLGSEVKFIETKKDDGKFWNFKKGSLTVFLIGDGKPPVSIQKKLIINKIDDKDPTIRAKALAMAVQMHCHSKFTYDMIENTADELLKYIFI